MTITTLIFDFGGVLIDLKREACIEAFDKLGIAGLSEQLNNYVQSGIFLQLETGQITAAEFRNEIRKLSSTPLTDEQIDSAWHAFLIQIPDEKLHKLVELRKKYRVVMLSNTNPIHFEHCLKTHFRKLGGALDDYFDYCYLSYKMGCAKPNPEIFHQLLATEGVQGHACLFFDDGEANIKTAKELGIHTYLVERGEWMHCFDAENNLIG